jgi:hypothetical protein
MEYVGRENKLNEKIKGSLLVTGKLKIPAN